jgi:hypothetical protein
MGSLRVDGGLAVDDAPGDAGDDAGVDAGGGHGVDALALGDVRVVRRHEARRARGGPPAPAVAVAAILGAADAATALRLTRSGGARRLGAPLLAAGAR